MSADYAVIQSQSANAFLEALRAVLLEKRAPEMSARFVFRGQGNSRWSLVPTAFRPGTILGYENREYTRKAADHPQNSWDQGNSEYVALLEFLKLADKVGLEIPADHKWFRSGNPFNNVVGHSIGTAEWPPEELYEALALAQHHGVPTRLLDFSYDPLVAAHFAADKAPSDAESIAVWCVDIELIALATRGQRSGLDIVTVPSTRNKNLAAQKALFLLARDIQNGGRMETSITTDIRSGEGFGRILPQSCAITQFCLPLSECAPLLDYLRRLGIDRAHLMPSFDGVVAELKARRKRLAMVQIPTVGDPE